MTRLLVSVRDREEALAAIDAGADLIDIKEPQRGALGRAKATTIAEITQAVAGRVPVSAAFGELTDWNEAEAVRFGDTIRGIQFAKIGLAMCARLPDWQMRWQAFNGCLPESAARVAVIYADAAACAPASDEVLEQAVHANCRAVLIDTFDKNTGALLTHWGQPQIQKTIQRIRSYGMMVVLGGSLDASAITTLLPLAPDLIAVRTAVCKSSSRTAPICPEQIRRLRALLNEGHRSPPYRSETQYLA